MHISFIYFDKHSPNLGHDTCFCLAPEEFQRSISGPWPKKVVHHCFKGFITDLFVTSSDLLVSRLPYFALGL